MIIWNWLKNKKPITISLKERQEGDVTVVCSKNMELFYLNKVGGIFLKNCNGKNTVNDVMIKLSEMFDVDEGVLIMDLVDIVRDLQFKRVIRLEA